MTRIISDEQQWVKTMFADTVQKPDTPKTLFISNMPELKSDITKLLFDYLTHHQNTFSSYLRFTKSKTNPAFGTNESERAKETAFTTLYSLANSFVSTPNSKTLQQLQAYCRGIQTSTTLGEIQRTAAKIFKRIQPQTEPQLNLDNKIAKEATAILQNNAELSQLLLTQKQIDDITNQLYPMDDDTGKRGNVSKTITVVTYNHRPFEEEKDVTITLAENENGEFELKIPSGIDLDEDTRDTYFAELFDAHTKLSTQLTQKTTERDKQAHALNITPEALQHAVKASHPLAKLYYLLPEEAFQKAVSEIKGKLTPPSLKAELQALREADKTLTSGPSPTGGRGEH